MRRRSQVLKLLFPIAAILATSAEAQVFRVPTPTPTPRSTPAPTPTPEPRPVPCPQVTVQVQGAQTLRDGQTAVFAANIAGGDPRVQPTLIWNTTAGAIRQGQYTRRIEVDTTGAGATYDRELRGEVWVSGYANECVLQASAKVKIIPLPVKFGEFGEVSPEVLKTNLDALAKYLAESPDNLYVIGYAGRKSERGLAATWLRRIRDELVAAGIANRRIAALDGGFREEAVFDFWIVPVGAEPPRPAPTVNRNEIVYPRTPPQKKPGGP
jgi:hypothetical protein